MALCLAHVVGMSSLVLVLQCADCRALQGRATNPNLDPKEPEGLFRDHVVELHKRACAGYTELLTEVLRPLLGPKPQAQDPREAAEERHTALSTFDGAEQLLQEDLRFARAPGRER